MEEKVSVGLLGLGVVGSGVIHLIEDHQEKLAHQLGCKVEVVKALVRNMEKARDIDVDQTILTTNPDDVLENPEIDLIIEVMGGIDHTKEYILKAFSNKKHIVSANKDLVAVYGPELQEAAVKISVIFIMKQVLLAVSLYYAELMKDCLLTIFKKSWELLTERPIIF